MPALVILNASGNVSAAFAATSSGVITQAPAAGALAATFTASGAATVRVNALGNVAANFAASGSVALSLGTGNVSATFAAQESGMSAYLLATGTVQATFASSLASPLVTAYVSGALAASFSAGFSPEAVGIPSSVSASFAAASAFSVTFSATGVVTALFTATSVTADLAVQTYSTQPGNPWIVSVESYSFQLQHRIWGGVGMPTANLGTDGDYYFRKDGASGSRMYARASGSWTAIN